MNYLSLINAFESWCEQNYLPISSQLLWYKLVSLFNRLGWREWISVDNHRLMTLMQMSREATFIETRDKLIKAGLFEYKKGKKGQPNQYKINTTILKVKTEVQTVVKSVVKTEVQTVAIIRDRVRYKHIVSDKINKILVDLTCAREELPEHIQIQLAILEETLYQLLQEGKEKIVDKISKDDIDLINISEDIALPVNYFKTIIEKKYGA